jgi:hypothetical protein
MSEPANLAAAAPALLAALERVYADQLRHLCGPTVDEAVDAIVAAGGKLMSPDEWETARGRSMSEGKK